MGEEEVQMSAQAPAGYVQCSVSGCGAMANNLQLNMDLSRGYEELDRNDCREISIWS